MPLGSESLTFSLLLQLESQLEDHETERSKSQRSTRNIDRAVKDLQSQVERKEKQNTQLAEDVNRMRDKVDKLLKTIDELQASESTIQLSARRAERELREEKEKALRLEKELEGWKGLRSEKSSVVGSLRNRLDNPDIARTSSINRSPSLTKGFI